MNMDLNIDNYSINDLKTFFKLDDGFSHSSIEENEYEIREQLLNSGDIDKIFKRDLIFFLDEAKSRLIQTLPTTKPPTSIPKNAILDYKQVPISENPAPRQSNLIERPITNYLNMKQSSFYEGTINPLATRSIDKYITIDTRFRDRFYATMSSDFMINLPTRINKVVSMQLTSVEIPTDFYSISSLYGNNFLIMQVFQMINGIGYDTSRIIIVPDGNYTAQGLIDKINDILSPKLSNGMLQNVEDIFSYIHFSLSASHDGSGSNKVIIQPNPAYPKIIAEIEEIAINFGTDVKGDNDSRYLTTKLGWNLGFTNTLYSGCNSYIGEKPIEPNNIKYIYLAIDDYNKNVSDSFLTAFEKNGLKPNILARISMRGRGYENVIINRNYEIVTAPRNYFGPVDLQRFHVSLFDDHGNILNMNNSDFSFCLKITQLYDL